jgi:hypothetical protein
MSMVARPQARQQQVTTMGRVLRLLVAALPLCQGFLVPNIQQRGVGQGRRLSGCRGCALAASPASPRGCRELCMSGGQRKPSLFARMLSHDSASGGGAPFGWDPNRAASVARGAAQDPWQRLEQLEHRYTPLHVFGTLCFGKLCLRSIHGVPVLPKPALCPSQSSTSLCGRACKT